MANVAQQLFSPAVGSYDELRTAAAEFVAAHWKEVEGTQTMRIKMAQLEENEVERAGPVMVALTRALAARAGGR